MVRTAAGCFEDPCELADLAQQAEEEYEHDISNLSYDAYSVVDISDADAASSDDDDLQLALTLSAKIDPRQQHDVQYPDCHLRAPN